MGYYDIAQRKIDLQGTTITLFAKPGMVPWDEVEAATTLLATVAEIRANDSVLVLEGGSGALAAWASRQCRETHYYDFNLMAARAAERTMIANHPYRFDINAGIDPESVDVVLLPIPKGRAFSAYLLAISYTMLKPGGRLYLAGPSDGGAKAIIKDAEGMFGEALTLRTKASNRAAVATKQHDAPPLDESRLRPEEFRAAGLRLFSFPGVFSAGALDTGTEMLISTLDARFCEKQRFLDIGCGYGVIGLAAAKMGAEAVDLVDVNWLALQCTQEGANVNGLPQCRVMGSDLYADLGDMKYDVILSNPPFHSGHSVDTQATEALIGGAKDHLVGGGRLRIVANRFLPYEKTLKSNFSSIRTVIEDGRYRVLEGRK